VDRNFKRYFSAGPGGAQPAERPWGYPGVGDVARSSSPRATMGWASEGRSGTRRLIRDATSAVVSRALRQRSGAGGCSKRHLP
jgi:hypothetical protein